MQCGPIRYRVDARKQAAARPLTHRVIRQPTSFRAPISSDGNGIPIQSLYGCVLSMSDSLEVKVFYPA